MAHLKDMEELLGSVISTQTKDYMEESLSCYMAGAYRASVVLTFIALFDDIIEKLGSLGKVNKKAEKIFDEASQKRADQEVFETFLIHQLKANSLFSSLDTTFLETLRILRNKAAHPSGHHTSAEEARFVFFEAISRFLSKPILSTTQLADEILANLNNANLFPSTSIGVIVKVVTQELQNIHPDTYPYLISKLITKTLDTDVEISMNSLFFLAGLANKADSAALVAIRKYGIEKICADKNFLQIVISLLSANGDLFNDLTEVTYERLRVLVSEQIIHIDISYEHTKYNHPTSMFLSLFKACPSSLVLEKLSTQFKDYLAKFPYSALFAKRILPHTEARNLLLDQLLKNAGSADFSTANGFASRLSDIESTISSSLTPKEAFTLLINVIRAAEIGAWNSIDAKNNHFASCPSIRSKADSYLVNDPTEAHKIAAEILKVDEAEAKSLLEYLKVEPPTV